MNNKDIIAFVICIVLIIAAVWAVFTFDTNWVRVPCVSALVIFGYILATGKSQS